MKKPLTTDELLSQFLQFARDHFAENSSEILLGENAANNPEFIVVPIKRRKNDNE
jgi:hypothetical protein